MHRDPVPPARLVRQAGVAVVPPPLPLGQKMRRAVEPLADGVAAHGRNALAILIGLWPLTAIMAVALALLWSAGYSSAP